MGGLLARGTYTGYLFGRLGMMWSSSPTPWTSSSGSAALFRRRAIPGKPSSWGMLLANIHLGPAVYVDAGLGYTGKEQTVRKSGIDLIGAFGVNIFNNYSIAGSIFAEVRVPVITTDRDFDNHHKLLLGFRYIF